jgi:predicted secreted hydrolase
MIARLPCLLLPAVLVVAGCAERPPDSGIRVADALGGAGDADPGFARALEPRAFRFPEDHGPHPAFRNEWWYVTGNLDDEQGRRYGFQLTFFRIGLDPDPPERVSAWAASDVWMAHAAVTDQDGRRHIATERFARGALDLAGARARPFRVWLEDWSLEAGEDGFPWRLVAKAGGFGLGLSLEPVKPPVLQGEGGLSRKSAEPGNASYYYSFTRMRARGTLRLGGEERGVEGLAWLDREWSTSALGDDQAGWDWVSLQLDDGRDLMFYRLRRTDGTTDPHSAGTLVSATGETVRLTPDTFSLEAARSWAADSGERYPVAWHLAGDTLDRPLLVRAVLDDQLMRVSVRYWEGAVDVLDPATGEALGRGYLEMTGYAEGLGAASESRAAQAR